MFQRIAKKVIKATILIIFITAFVGDEILNFTKNVLKVFAMTLKAKLIAFSDQSHFNRENICYNLH